MRTSLQTVISNKVSIKRFSGKLGFQQGDWRPSLIHTGNRHMIIDRQDKHSKRSAGVGHKLHIVIEGLD